MADEPNRGCDGGWRLAVGGLTRAYSTVRVDPANFFCNCAQRTVCRLADITVCISLEIGELDGVADSIIRSGMKVAAVEGAGFGLGGLITIVPDLGILSAITMRTIQKLSLLYGFEFNTDDEIAELWVAAASAAGVDISRELLEKEVVNKFVPKVIQRIAAKASTEVVEKWAGRVIPLGQRRNWRGTELLVRSRLGRARQGALSPAALTVPAAGITIGLIAASQTICSARRLSPCPQVRPAWKTPAVIQIVSNAYLHLRSHSF